MLDPIRCVQAGKACSGNWGSNEVRNTARIREATSPVPRRFRDEWSQPVAGPTQPAATPHNHNAISSTAEGEPTVAENHSHQQHRPITKLSAPPRCCTRPTIPWVYSQDSFPSSPPLLTLHYLPCYIPFSVSFFFGCTPLPPSLPPHRLLLGALYLSRLPPAQ